MNYLSLRSISILLGSLWEASPYILTPLKAPIKLSLHLSHKIRHILQEHKKLILALLSYHQGSNEETAKRLYTKYKDHPIYGNLINLIQPKVKQQIGEVKKQLMTISWDTNLLSLKEELLKCNLVTPEIKSFISESVDYISEQMKTFSKMAEIFSFLKIPLNFNPNSSCRLVEDRDVEKYIICLTDSSPSREDFLCLDKPKFSYGFTSYVIYLAHFCTESSTYKFTLLSSSNKLSTPNLDILRAEAQGPAIASKRVTLLARVFRVPNENVLFFMDNLPFLCLVRNYEKNYLTYKVFFVKLIQELT